MLNSIPKKEALAMRKMYLMRESNIKKALDMAIKKGDDAIFLKKVLSQIQDEIKLLDKYNKGYSQNRLIAIFRSNQERVDKAVKSFDNKFDITSALGKPNNASIKILSDNTTKGLNNVTIAIGRQSEDLIRQIGLKYSKDILKGSATWQTTAKEMADNLKKNDYFTIPYKLKDGGVRNVPARAYSEMVARTTAAQAQREATNERITQWGYDLIDIIGKSSNPNSPCIPYEGQTLSINGDTAGYTSLSEAEGAGLFHPNCIHDSVFSDANLETIE